METTLKVATKIRNLDPGEFGITDPAAQYLLTPAFMGAERIIARRVSGTWESCVDLVGASVHGDRLETLRDVWGAKDHAEAFGTYGYEVVDAAAREVRS